MALRLFVCDYPSARQRLMPFAIVNSLYADLCRRKMDSGATIGSFICSGLSC